MSSQIKTIKNIQPVEVAFIGLSRIIGLGIRFIFKLAAMFYACQAKHCHNLIADIHEAVRYSESQGVRSNATKQATAKRIAKLEADAARWAARQQALLVRV